MIAKIFALYIAIFFKQQNTDSRPPLKFYKIILYLPTDWILDIMY